MQVIQDDKETVDFLLADYGSVTNLVALSPEARQAATDGTIELENWQWQGGSFLVDTRYAEDLIECLQNDGFTFAWE